MKPETIHAIRIHWSRLRLVRRSGSVLVDYRIIKNIVRLMQRAGASA